MYSVCAWLKHWLMSCLSSRLFQAYMSGSGLRRVNTCGLDCRASEWVWMCLKPISHIMPFFFFRDRNPQPSMIPLNIPFSSENVNLYENTNKYHSTWYLDFRFHLTFCLTSSCLAYLSHISQFSVQTCALIMIREELLSLDRMAAVHQPSLKCISICKQQLECLRLQQQHCWYVTTAWRQSIKHNVLMHVKMLATEIQWTGV